MDGFLGEVRLFSGTYELRGWRFCQGQILQISKEVALHHVLGNVYGGDGVTTFALPNLPGPTPLLRYLICVNGYFPTPHPA